MENTGVKHELDAASERKKRAEELQAKTVAALKELLNEMPEDFIVHVEPESREAEDG